MAPSEHSVSSRLLDALAIVAAVLVTVASALLVAAPLILMLALAYWLVKQA